jgi:hypothetical protein
MASLNTYGGTVGVLPLRNLACEVYVAFDRWHIGTVVSAFRETRTHDVFVRVCSILAGAAGGGLTISPVQSMAVSCGSEEARGAWVTALRAAVALCVTHEGELLVHEGTVRRRALWLVLRDHVRACVCEGRMRDCSSQRCSCPFCSFVPRAGRRAVYASVRGCCA